MPQIDRAAAKAAGYTDAEIDAFLAQQAPTPTAVPSRPMPAARGPAAQESTRVTPRPPAPARPDLTAGQEAVGLARSLARGASFGFSPEIEAGVRAMGSATYPEAYQQVQREMATYQQARPGVALGAEVVGGLATGGGGAIRSAGGLGLRRALQRGGERLAKSAVGQGALAGAGEAEGGLGSRAAGAATGAAAGGFLGGVLGRAAQAVGTRAVRGGPADIGAQFTRGLMEESGVGPRALRTEAQRLAEIAPETRIADLLGEAGQRAARGQAGLGGEAGERVAQAMRTRYAERPQRMQDVLTRGTGQPPENLLQTMEEIRSTRKAAADPLYERAFANPPVADPGLDQLIKQRPSLAKAEQEAITLMREAGRPVQVLATEVNGVPTTVPVRTPEFLDYMKKAVDDMLYVGKRSPAEGGLGPASRSNIQKTRNEFMERLDAAIPGYKEARATWAGETALIHAAEEGADMAAKRMKPEAVAEVLQGMGDSEREMLQRGYLDKLRERIDADQLKPAELRSPAFAKRTEAIFGPDAPAVLDGLAAELRLMETAGMVQAGARTAPMQVDIERAAGPASRLGQMTMRARTVARDPFMAAARGFDLLAEPLSATARQGQRMARTEALLTPAADIGSLLGRVQREAQATTRGAQIGRQVGRRTGRVAGQQFVRGLFAPPFASDDQP